MPLAKTMSINRPVIAIPADDPVQIANSPRLEQLRPRGELRIYHDRPSSLEEQLERVRDAEVLINSRGQVKWPRPLLEQLPRLKMVTTCSIGTDSIDLDAARDQGIVVSNIPGRTAPVVAEHAFGLMFAAAKRAAFQTSELKAGRWTRSENILLSGKTLGVIGTGSIGRELARLAAAIQMRVLAWTFHPSVERAQQLGVEFVHLDQLLADSDVVSIHLKLTPDSQEFLGKRELSQMKSGSLLINTARGAVVDSLALVAALQEGHLAGAALDVFDEEPLPRDHPILSCDQVVLTPHNADQTPEGIDLLNAGAVENVLAFLDGNPQHVVT
jgi:phosphoglycerate dehydrogenase-like enzyme